MKKLIINKNKELFDKYFDIITKIDHIVLAKAISEEKTNLTIE